MAVGWGIPAIVVGCLLILDPENIIPTKKRNPNFQYGNAQAAVSLFVLVISFIGMYHKIRPQNNIFSNKLVSNLFNPFILVTVGCLVLHQRYKRRVENYLSLTKELSTESVDTKDTVINDAERNTFIRTESDDQETMRNRLRQTVQSQETCTSTSSAPDIEDLCKPMNGDKPFRSNEMCSSSFACSGQSRQQCQTLVSEYNERQQLEFMEFYKSIQSLRHTVLLILLLCSMFVVCIRRI